MGNTLSVNTDGLPAAKERLVAVAGLFNSAGNKAISSLAAIRDAYGPDDDVQDAKKQTQKTVNQLSKACLSIGQATNELGERIDKLNHALTAAEDNAKVDAGRVSSGRATPPARRR
ncbi:hypothetical protein, partial [Streptomyces fructofermentans]|uniref:hypothetical protein n=1 Tax=Streptomyces fructofermentans TaxID=152141 RepID=UPI0033C41CB6